MFTNIFALAGLSSYPMNNASGSRFVAASILRNLTHDTLTLEDGAGLLPMTCALPSDDGDKCRA
jgi:hypothetical protein